MKKTLITSLAASALSLSAFAQGSLNMNGTVANDPGVTTQGANAGSTANASTYFTGTISLEVFALASATQGELNAINAFINTANGGANALALAQSDGFVEASTTTLNGSTVGSVSGNVSGGTIQFSPAAVGLTGVTTSSTESLFLYAVAVGGVNAGWAGGIAFNNNVGGDPNATPIAGTAAALTGWGALNQNLVLSSAAAVPEPTTMALAGLGSLSLFLLRRKK